LGDFWAWDGDILMSKENPRAKTPKTNHFCFIQFTLKKYLYPIYSMKTRDNEQRGLTHYKKWKAGNIGDGE
jgi:hypothetical protein